jgi:alpha-L-arabinofuranosidase
MCACALTVSSVAANDPLRAEIEIFPARSLGPISPYVFGAGIDHKTNPMRFCRHPEQVARDIAESHLRIARYPGGFVFARDDQRGSWKNFYWQDHIGRNPDRKPFYTYDLDTFVQMCERFGIEPLMQINFVGEPEDSIRGYIEYLVGDGDIDGDGVDWAARRTANGRAEPYRIRYWQLGNEVHDPPQGFRGNAEGAREYAAALNRLAPMIRRLAPEAKIVAPFINIQRPRSELGGGAAHTDINYATSAEFARAFLEHLRVPVDYLDWHFYAANGWDGNYPFLGTDDEWKHYYCWGTKFRECYAAVADLLRRGSVQQPLPRIVVGEWSGDWTGDIFRAKKDSYRGSMMRTMASAVFMADILMFMTEKSIPAEHIHAAFWHNFANGAQELFSIQATEEYRRALGGARAPWGDLTEDGYGIRLPVYWVFSLLSEQRGEELVASRLDAPGNRIAAPRNGLYWDPAYHFERVTHCATKRGDSLFVAILNKDAHAAVDVRLLIREWTPTAAVEIHAVGAESYLAENTPANPARVTRSGPDIATIGNPSDARFRISPNTLKVLRFTRDPDRQALPTGPPLEGNSGSLPGVRRV